MFAFTLFRFVQPRPAGEAREYERLLMPLLFAVSIFAAYSFIRERHWAHIAMRVLASAFLVVYVCVLLFLLWFASPKDLHDISRTEWWSLVSLFGSSLLVALYTTVVAWRITLQRAEV